ncbi:VanZ family protein [Clostridioides sp. ZZV14-6009]|nr:VanZ family protein [Clostridioides sp. ZZV14-6150]MCC0667692.1 VanZ family protein [Clostridioides sp. ZZV14-6153]MCC0721839.1 VanZ family protein [Clostridioides sp. ZZV14-6104]MCC0730111.1 VanZ family protein [Clostridioides sp. ZZV14-6048]MCC0734494.1 VanZ family protein [Clostridioides sp. ZZV14-6009]MCC0738484.1 VanZ family protein [Clostridioides sp. ZZV14-5902]MCC0750843.1 VanZ family protein [Clostridioides sp. ZZV13-5731]
MMWTLYPLFCAILPCLIYQIIVIRKVNLKEKRSLITHLIWVYVFLFYIYLALSKAGIGSIWDIGRYDEIIRLDEINLIPFSSSGALTYILNIIMFMPLGFLLPLIWERFRNFISILWTGLVFSLAIEICQLFNHRATDIDDLMMNTLGAILGYFIWICINNLFNYISKKTLFSYRYEQTVKDEIAVEADDDTNRKAINLPKNETIMYLILAVLGEFLLYNFYIIPY